jgi:diguanylate cyclase (GGDEF)-like protein/PAS domain S-box-containing protein
MHVHVTQREPAGAALAVLAQESERRDRIQSVMLASISDFAYLFDRAGRFLFANQRLLDLWQLPLERVVGRNFHDLKYPPELAQRLQAQIADVYADGKAITDATVHTDAAGASHDYEYIFSPVFDADGRVEFVVGASRDVTERRKTSQGLLYLNRVYAMLSSINSLIVRARSRDELFKETCRIAVEVGGFRGAMIGILDEGRIRFAAVSATEEVEADAARHMLESNQGRPTAMSAEAIRSQQPCISNDSQNDPRVAFPEAHAAFRVRSMAILPLVVDGDTIGTFQLYAGEDNFFHSEERKLLKGLVADVAFAMAHIDKQLRLEYLAYYDRLTGLANRSLFLERAADCLRSCADAGHGAAMVLVNLERFKSINDSLGRPVGDELLKQVGAWLGENLPDANLLARIASDQFAFMLCGVTNSTEAAPRLEALIAGFREHDFLLQGEVFRIAARFGAAMFPDDGNEEALLFKRAESALKQAKSEGNRMVFYTESMTESVARKLSLETQLRHALDNEEFVLHYQPKVNLLRGGLTGCEALIRWNDPRSGLVSPGQFIPVLEETGLIFEVGRWALRQALADYLRWHQSGLPAVRIAVNVSPLQLRNAGFVAEIGRMLAVDEEAGGGLELEITESMIMGDIEQSIASLTQLRAMGVSIAIDDFGTGFSSLGYLSRLPIDCLKIDLSFVRDMGESPEGLSLVSTIITLAHSLRLKVVAEGVETAEQANLLRLLRCDDMQGYFFSKPVPADVFEERFLR